jgi:outer membrane protein TolC
MSIPMYRTLRRAQSQGTRTRWRGPFSAVCCAYILCGALACLPATRGAENRNPEDTSAWTSHPLTLEESLDLAFKNNAGILQARDELEANYGISMQIRSIALPQLKASGDFTGYNASNIQALQVPLPAATHRWLAYIRIEQSLYEGGRIRSALKSSSLNRQQAIARYQATVADRVFDIRTAYFDVLLAEVQVDEEQSAWELVNRQHDEVKSRLGTGLVERYDLLHSEVLLASGRSRLVRGQTQLRLAKAKFVQLLGFSVPARLWDSMPLKLADPLKSPPPYSIELQDAMEQALQNRPEIEAQAKSVPLARENLTDARSGYKPSVKVVAGYGGFNDDLDRDIHGWFGGAQVNWNIFDGMQSLGKVREAQARLDAAETGLRDLKRSIALEVQNAYSSFIEAKELLATQDNVQAMTEEGLRLAKSRFHQGNLTHLEVLSAENDLADARLTTSQTLRDYHVALAGLQRAIGIPIEAK